MNLCVEVKVTEIPKPEGRIKRRGSLQFVYFLLLKKICAYLMFEARGIKKNLLCLHFFITIVFSNKTHLLHGS